VGLLMGQSVGQEVSRQFFRCSTTDQPGALFLGLVGWTAGDCHAWDWDCGTRSSMSVSPQLQRPGARSVYRSLRQGLWVGVSRPVSVVRSRGAIDCGGEADA
jgi:hypothetical protein